MKYAILSVTISLILGGCAAAPTSIGAYDNGVATKAGSVSAFPVNLHGGQPYMAQPANLRMQPCAVTATAFEAPSSDPTVPMKVVAAACSI
jgi:hypothetical protein